MKIEKTPEMMRIASRLAWFISPEEAIEQPQLLLTQVMTLGTIEDVLTVRQAVGLDEFRKVLDSASPGAFDPRSWAYWNLICGRRTAPPLPSRQIP